MNNLVSLAKQIQKQNGKGLVFVGDYVFDLEDIEKKLNYTK